MILEYHDKGCGNIEQIRNFFFDLCRFFEILYAMVSEKNLPHLCAESTRIPTPGGRENVARSVQQRKGKKIKRDGSSLSAQPSVCEAF